LNSNSTPGATPPLARAIQYASFKGTKREAQVKLAALITSVGTGSYVEPSKSTVAEFVRARVTQWEAAGDISARTAQRYRQLVENQLAPHVGAKTLQKLTRLDVEGWHKSLRNGGLAARTVGHAHRVLGKALSDAESDGVVVKNVCKLQRAPKVAESEMAIVRTSGTLWPSCAVPASTSPPWWRYSPACGSERCWRSAGAASISTPK
jgi:hypothetical protein